MNYVKIVLTLDPSVMHADKRVTVIERLDINVFGDPTPLAEALRDGKFTVSIVETIHEEVERQV